ncbi:MAG: hypothetical protein LCI03_03090 [Actinobacteria bacterium]|jgi:hypothetical protein|nr:hypothetical protein [Actinomycetota bacterium]
MRIRHALTAIGAFLATAALLLLNPVVAQAAAATSVTPSLAFSGSGTTLSVVTKVSFKSGYAGAYYVKYDIYRSTSSKKTSPIRVTLTSVSQTYATTVKGSTYTTTTTTKSCPAGTNKTTYYYWIQGTVSDGGTGVVSFNGTPVAKVACLSVY